MTDSRLKKDPWYVIRIQESKILDYFFAFLFAILPIVQPLRSFLPVTWSMAILILSVPYIALKFLIAGKLKLTHTWPIWLYCGYRIINHGTSIQELLTMLFLVALYITLLNRLFDIRFFYKIIVFITLFAAILVILQTICHYLFGFHIVLLDPSSLRTADLRRDYDYQLRTGICGSLYRPSAFFVEPTSIAEYSLPVLFFLLVDKNNKSYNYSLGTTLIISVGILLSTSGLGILILVVFWSYYFISGLIINGKVRVKNLLIVILVIIIVLVLILYVPILNSTVTRLFVNTDGTNSAINGRFEAGHRYYNSLNFEEKIFGTGNDTDKYELYTAGMHTTILSDGIICYILFCLVFINLALIIKNRYCFLIVAILVLSVFANIVCIDRFIYLLISIGMGIEKKYEEISIS